MAKELERLLSAVRGGKLSPREMQEVGALLRQGLSDEQNALVDSLLGDPQKARDFLNTPDVQKILKDE